MSGRVLVGVSSMSGRFSFFWSTNGPGPEQCRDAFELLHWEMRRGKQCRDVKKVAHAQLCMGLAEFHNRVGKLRMRNFLPGSVTQRYQ